MKRALIPSHGDGIDLFFECLKCLYRRKKVNERDERRERKVKIKREMQEKDR